MQIRELSRSGAVGQLGGTLGNIEVQIRIIVQITGSSGVRGNIKIVSCGILGVPAQSGPLTLGQIFVFHFICIQNDCLNFIYRFVVPVILKVVIHATFDFYGQALGIGFSLIGRSSGGADGQDHIPHAAHHGFDGIGRASTVFCRFDIGESGIGLSKYLVKRLHLGFGSGTGHAETVVIQIIGILIQSTQLLPRNSRQIFVRSIIIAGRDVCAHNPVNHKDHQAGRSVIILNVRVFPDTAIHLELDILGVFVEIGQHTTTFLILGRRRIIGIECLAVEQDGIRSYWNGKLQNTVGGGSRIIISRIINGTGCIKRTQGKILGIGIGPAVRIKHVGRPGRSSCGIGVDMHTVNTAEIIVLLNHIRRHFCLGILAWCLDVQYKLRCNLFGLRIVQRIGFQLLTLATGQRGQTGKSKKQYRSFHRI